jgi:hypothetical protein
VARVALRLRAVAMMAILAAVPVLAEPTYEAPSGPQAFARLIYPASGVIDTTEGTCELWVRNDFAPTVRLANQFYSPMTYLRVRDAAEGSDRMWVLTRSVASGRDFGYIVGEVLNFLPTTAEHTLNWRAPDEWHHLALTWQLQDGRYVLKLYQDGRLVDQVTDSQSVPLTVGPDTVLCIGSFEFSGSFATVDEVRVSAVARTAAELAAIAGRPGAELPWDSSTTLLDHLDHAIPSDAGQGLSWSLAEGGIRGRIEGSFRQVAGPCGRALQLHVVDEQLLGGPG